MGHTSFESKSVSRRTGLRQSFDQVLWYRWFKCQAIMFWCHFQFSCNWDCEWRVQTLPFAPQTKYQVSCWNVRVFCLAGTHAGKAGGGLGVNRQAFKLRKAANYQSETLSNITLMSRTLLGGGEWKGFPEVRSASRRRSAAFHSSHHSGPLRRWLLALTRVSLEVPDVSKLSDRHPIDLYSKVSALRFVSESVPVDDRQGVTAAYRLNTVVFWSPRTGIYDFFTRPPPQTHCS